MPVDQPGVAAARPDAGIGGLLVVLPAWNEQDALPGVLTELRQVCAEVDLLVVSDGSTDGTVAVARGAGIPVLDLPFNLGVGGAMRAGFRYAREHQYTHVVQVDADGQHDPRSIRLLWDAMSDTGADLIVGSRFDERGSYAVRGPRRWAMVWLSWVLSRIVGTRLTDTTSGFKLMGPRAVAVFAHEYPAEYLGDTVEALVLAWRCGLTVREVQVRMRERAGGVASHSPIKAAVFLARALVSVVVALTRRRVRIDEGRGS